MNDGALPLWLAPGHPVQQVISVGNVRLGGGQVLVGQPVEIDAFVGAVAEARDVAVRIVGELLVVGAVAGAGALRAAWVECLREPVETVIDIARLSHHVGQIELALARPRLSRSPGGVR